MSDQVLELNALDPDRSSARLPDGNIYELKVPEDFGSVGFRKVGKLFSKVEDLLDHDLDLTKAQEKQLEQSLDDLACELIVGAPPEVASQIPAIKKRALALRFFGQAGEDLRSLVPALQTLEISPPAVSGSTEEIQSDG